MMLYGRLIHLLPFLAVGLLEACGGTSPAADAIATPRIAVGEPYPLPSEQAHDFDLLSNEPVSGITGAQNVVLRNAAEFSALWAVHMRNRVPVPPVPAIDFTRKMVVGVFVGQLNHGCGGASIHHASYAASKVTVTYSATTAMPEVCTMVMGSPSALAVVDRSDAPVEFVAAPATVVPLATVDLTAMSLLGVPRNVVVKDQAAWTALWAEHKGAGSTAPPIDFARNMVVASFHGPGNGCASLALPRALRSGPVVTVQRRVTVPPEGVACTLIAKTPAHIVTMERTDDQVVFATETVEYR